MTRNFRSPAHSLQRMQQSLLLRRKVLGFSRAELAQRSSVSPATIQRFENTGVITSDNLVKLLHSLNMIEQVLSGFESQDSWTVEQHEKALAIATNRKQRSE